MKNVLVTGATSGIGKATCDSLLKEGYQVFALGRDVEKIKDLLDQFSEQLHFLVIDLNSYQEYTKIFDDFLSGQKLDGLVHCAGIEETLPINLYTPEAVQRIFNLNVFSGIELMRFFAKKKYSNEGAGVVFLASVMATLGQAGKTGYCASKSAILGMVKSLALELAKRKIRVNAISPGVVNTPMTQKLFSQIEKDNIERIKNMHPLGIGEVDDVTPSILFLLSEGSKWITGQNFIVDGGYSIQ